MENRTKLIWAMLLKIYVMWYVMITILNFCRVLNELKMKLLTAIFASILSLNLNSKNEITTSYLKQLFMIFNIYWVTFSTLYSYISRRMNARFSNSKYWGPKISHFLMNQSSTKKSKYKCEKNGPRYFRSWFCIWILL